MVNSRASATHPIQSKVLQADQTVNNSTTLVDVTNLTADIVAGKKYFLRIVMYFTSGTTPDIKWTVNGTSTFTALRISGTPNSHVFVATTATMAGSNNTDGNDQTAQQEYAITCSASGTIKLQFAQLTANASATIMRAGTSLILFS